MCIIEFVDYNETYTTDGGKKKSTRTRRGSGKKTAKVEEAPVAEAVEETAPVSEAEAPAAE